MAPISRHGAALWLALAATACATTGHLPNQQLGRWPAAPDPARVILLGELRTLADFDMEGAGSGLLELLTGAPDPAILRPYSIAVVGEAVGTGPGGEAAKGPARIAVADSSARGVHLFDLEGGHYTLLREASESLKLMSPTAVAFDERRRLYVCDSALGLLIRYDADGRLDTVISRSLQRPSGLAIDRRRGRLYVSDAAEHVVYRMNLDGTSRQVISESFRFPTHLAVDRAGRLFVTDTMNFKVKVISPEGRLIATIGAMGDGSGDLQRPKGVAIDSDNHVYVVDALFDNVQVFSLSGRLLLSFGGAGAGPARLSLPAGMAIDERDLLYVADSYNGRVLLFRYLRGEEP